MGCKQLSFGSIVLFSRSWTDPATGQSFVWRGLEASAHVVGVGQPEGGGLVHSSGPGLLPQPSLFLESSFLARPVHMPVSLLTPKGTRNARLLVLLLKAGSGLPR